MNRTFEPKNLAMGHTYRLSWFFHSYMIGWLLRFGKSNQSQNMDYSNNQFTRGLMTITSSNFYLALMWLVLIIMVILSCNTVALHSPVTWHVSNFHSLFFCQQKNCSKMGIASSQTLPLSNEEIRRFGGGNGNLGNLSPNPIGLRQTISARGS